MNNASHNIFNAALAAVDPYRAVLDSVSREGDKLLVAGQGYQLKAFERVLVAGAGKATARMAAAIETLLDKEISAGLIVVKSGHQISALRCVQQLEASHPLPDAAGVAATRRILEMLHTADEKTLVICLLSGGASALLVAPVEGLSLQDKQQVTDWLLKSGASISELNAVRKHLSRVKGGRLALAANPATVITLILSDVIGNPLDVIASGPTAADQSTYVDAWAVLVKYQLLEKIPVNVKNYLHDGVAGLHRETIKKEDPCLSKVQNVVIGSLEQALFAAAKQANELGWPAEICSSSLQGEAREVAKELAERAKKVLKTMRPGARRCLISGGETTVTVKGRGRGGRNQELALAFALEIAGCRGITLLSAGTDGNDGPTDAAGALVDGTTIIDASRHGMDALTYLDNNDAYEFFQKLDIACGSMSHFKTGPTGTNVMDIQIVLLEGN